MLEQGNNKVSCGLCGLFPVFANSVLHSPPFLHFCNKQFHKFPGTRSLILESRALRPHFAPAFVLTGTHCFFSVHLNEINSELGSR